MRRNKYYSITSSFVTINDTFTVKRVKIKGHDDIFLMSIHDKSMLPLVRKMLDENGYKEVDESKEDKNNK